MPLVPVRDLLVDTVPKDTNGRGVQQCTLRPFDFLERCDVLKLSRYFGTRQFCKSALLLTLPILAQNLLTTSFSLVDTLMISSLGTIELTSVGLAASWIQLLNVLLFGISSAAGVLVAQFWGGSDLKEVRRSFGGGLSLCVTVTVLFLAFTACCPKFIMGLYSNDPLVIAAGAKYLRLVAFGFPAFGLQYIANSTLRSTEQVRTPMYGTIISVLVNICFNYALIFGHFGAPALGLEGAAIASCIANWAGVAVTYTLAFARRTVIRAQLRQVFRFDSAFVRRYFAVAWPIMLNEVFWGGGTAVLNMIYGHMGTLEYAALTMCNTLENVITMVFLSLANSANVLVGKEIGSGREEKAYQNALAISCWTPVIAALFAVLMLLLRHPITAIFQQTEDVTALALKILLVMALTLPLRFFQYIHICGILRSGADGKKAAFYDFVGVWCVSVPLALLGLFAGVPFLWVYLVVCLLDSLVKDVLVLRRFLSRKWMQRVSDV